MTRFDHKRRALPILTGILIAVWPAAGAAQDTEGEWHQHAHDAQHTSYSPEAVPTPWRWRWSWNGPDSDGGVSTGKTPLPRGVQPVTGNGRVYIARGAEGVIALDGDTGMEVWTANPGGSINSTLAYDPDTNAVFAVSSDGSLYKLNADSGEVIGTYAASEGSSLALPAAIDGDQVFFSMGSSVYAVNKLNMELMWVYAAEAEVHTPPAYSPSRDLVIVATQDLFVHAIDNSSGQRLWRVKHTPLSLGDPGERDPYAEVSYGWPVIAEAHGYVLVKLRLNWNSMWEIYETNNASIRQFLEDDPEQQALLVIDLDDGAMPFVANIGHGGFGDGGYIPMGFQPAVKRFEDGTEVAYVLARGETRFDSRWDSHLGELVLDDSTADGFLAGYFRYIDFAGTTINSGDVFITDEQPFLSVAGDYLFANHWEASMYSLRITDRDSSKGTYENPIETETLYTMIESQDEGDCNNTSHFVTDELINTRTYPNEEGGFHIYCQQGAIYDEYWSDYATTVISDGMIITVSTSGSVVALENGNPT